MVILEGTYKRGLENKTCCEASGIRSGVTAVQQILRRGQGFLQSRQASEIIHETLMNCYRLNKNRLKSNRETRIEVKRNRVELEAGLDNITENWCCSTQVNAGQGRHCFQGKQESRRETCQEVRS